MARYTIDEVAIEGGYPVEEILELTMDIGVNRHGALTYGGFISPSAADQYIRQSAANQPIKVSLAGKPEFCGYPQQITVDRQNEHHYLRVTLVTASQLIDLELRERFFQDPSRTFADIITEAYADSGLGNLVAIRGTEKIAKPILQYRETDWQFTQRIAGRLGTMVITDVTAAQPYIMLGIPNRPVLNDTSNLPYSITRDAAAFRQAYETDSRTTYREFLSRKMDSDNHYRLGDSVKLSAATFVVMEKQFSYANGLIQEHYVFGQEREFAVPFHHNQRITGLELSGRVLERRDQEMRVLLDIDANRAADGRTWFRYSPCTNNGMYSMPLKDEKVMLQWQSAQDEDILIVRPNRQNGYGMPNHQERHFLTEDNAHLKMIPGTLAYANPAGNINLVAGSGFRIATGGSFAITAGQDITITAQGQVRGYSPERISLCKAGVASSIDMFGNELHIKAVTNVQAKSQANKYNRTILPQRTPPITIAAKTAAKLAAAMPQVTKVNQ